MSKGTVLTKKNFKENIRKLNEKIVVLGLAQGLLEDVLNVLRTDESLKLIRREYAPKVEALIYRIEPHRETLMRKEKKRDINYIIDRKIELTLDRQTKLTHL